MCVHTPHPDLPGFLCLLTQLLGLLQPSPQIALHVQETGSHAACTQAWLVAWLLAVVATAVVCEPEPTINSISLQEDQIGITLQ